MTQLNTSLVKQFDSNVQTILIVANTLEKCAWLHQQIPDQLSVWFNVNTSNTHGQFAVQALGFDRLISWTDDTIQVSSHQGCLYTKANVSLSSTVETTNLPSPQLSDTLFQDITQRYQQTLQQKFSGLDILPSPTLPLLEHQQVLQVFPTMIFDGTYQLHPQKQGWTLQSQKHIWNNTNLFLELAKQYRQRKRGTVYLHQSIDNKTSESWMQTFEQSKDIHHKQAFMTLEEDGAWILPQGYFPFHDPLYQLLATINICQQLMKENPNKN